MNILQESTATSDNNINLYELIRNDKKAISDREGLKPLMRLSETLVTQPNLIDEYKIEEQLLSLRLSTLNIDEISSLINFIYYSKINSKKISTKILQTLERELIENDFNIAAIRGLLIRFVSESNPDLITLKYMLEQIYLRKNHPWLWVDSVANINRDFAIDEIASILSHNSYSVKNLILRLPSYKKVFTNEEITKALNKWYINTRQKSERLKLEKWVSEFKIKIGLSAQAEYLLDNVNFYQNEILS